MFFCLVVCLLLLFFFFLGGRAKCDVLQSGRERFKCECMPAQYYFPGLCWGGGEEGRERARGEEELVADF